MRRLTPIVMLGFLWLSAQRAVGADMTIVDAGKPVASIVIAAQACDRVRHAAQELQVYIEKISQAKLPIVTAESNPSGTMLLVGKSALTDAMGIEIPSGATIARREEGFVIVCQGERLVLAGNNDGPYHGTEYAVYDFLRSLGVRWFMPGEFGEIIPEQPTVRVTEQRIHEAPDFGMRNWWVHTPAEVGMPEAEWKLRNKMNPDALAVSVSDGSVSALVAPAVQIREKPELFALNEDGTRNPGLPNLTNPDAVTIAADRIKEYFRAHPEENAYGFAPSDGLPRDFNPDTMKLNSGLVAVVGRLGVPSEVNTSEEWFAFVNRVTAEVRRDFPNAYVGTNGYCNRDMPPKTLQLDDHVIVMFAAIWSCTLHSYDNDACWQKVRQGQMLERWCKAAKNVWVYGYTYNMLVTALTPVPEFTKLRHDFPLMKRWGVLGFYDETRNAWAEPGIASKYLRAQLEWNAGADVDAILDDFFARWYGGAAKPMMAFYCALDDAITKTSMHGHEDRILPEVYTAPLLAELARDLDEAEQAADTERAKLHVRIDRLIYDHLAAYKSMSNADAAGRFADAARDAEKMLALREELHAINPFFFQPPEEGNVSGVFYWRISDRKEYYESLADKLSGKTGDLVAMLPGEAQFRTDPHDDGLFAEWYRPEIDERGWRPIQTARPFYCQGYEDDQGHTYTGGLWYRLAVDMPESAQGKEVRLCIPALATEAWCWVNGQYVGHRPYQEAYIRPAAMDVDVTNALHPGQSNQITVRVHTSLCESQAAEGLESRLFLYAPKRTAG